MIKGNELRIGNWVERNGFNVRITSIGADDSMTDGGYSKHKDLQPIYLTPEIFDKMGFKFMDLGISFCFQKVDKTVRHSLTLHRVENDFVFINGHEHLTSARKIQFVHEVQNLWYAVTGHELQINL